MVPKAGFEPAHPQGALDPESSASASFATSAWTCPEQSEGIAIISFCPDERQASHPR